MAKTYFRVASYEELYTELCEGGMDPAEAQNFAAEIRAWNAWWFDREEQINHLQAVLEATPFAVFVPPPPHTVCHWCGHPGPLHHAYDHIIPCGEPPNHRWLHCSCWDRRQANIHQTGEIFPDLPPPPDTAFK